jgi:hypothetical protein
MQEYVFCEAKMIEETAHRGSTRKLSTFHTLTEMH